MTDFVCVSYKKHKKNKTKVDYSHLDISSPGYITQFNNKIIKARDFLKTSSIYCDILSSIEEAVLKKQSKVEEIVCYGLGSISDSSTSRYQFALLIELKHHLKCEVFLFDPLFSDIDKAIFFKENFIVIDSNELGRRRVYKTTLFFLPHCPSVLFNNVLAANWGMNLSNCIILGNSLSKIMCSTTDKKLEFNVPHLYNISSFVTESIVLNNFQYQDVFNDFAVHIFLDENLKLVDINVWEKEYNVGSDMGELVLSLTNSLGIIDLGI